MLTNNNQETQVHTDLEYYADTELDRFIREQESKLEGRKLIAEALFFVGCQVLSNSLAVLLFQYALRIWLTYLIIWAIALIPALGDLCNVHFSQEDQGWRVTLMRSPIKSIFKIVIGVGVLSVGISEVREMISDTSYGIQRVYAEIRAYQEPKVVNYDLVQLSPWVSLIAAIGLVGFILYIKEK